jgi:hypothetical protein
VFADRRDIQRWQKVVDLLSAHTSMDHCFKKIDRN